MATTDKSTGADDKSTEATTSTSAQDASTTEGAKAAGIPQPAKTPSSAGGAASTEQAAQDSTVKVQIEQAPPEPDVLYPGSNDATDPDRPHVRAKYEPFSW